MPTDPQFWDEVVLQTLTLFVLLVGWLGLLIPVFPGLVVMWLATLVYALLENAAGRMAWIDWVLFGLISLLMVLGNIVDDIIIARKMRGRSIPWSSILLAFLAGLVASLLFTPLVGLAASPLTLFAAESIRLHNRRQGFASARAYMVAWGWSFAAVFGIGALMIVLWLFWAFFRTSP
jgi:uncharacterized protein YqgC (DUF456 family)